MRSFKTGVLKEQHDEASQEEVPANRSSFCWLTKVIHSRRLYHTGGIRGAFSRQEAVYDRPDK
jgi:hypothetical protein